MKNKALLILSILVLTLVAVIPVYASDTAWTGTIPATVTEPLVVKVGTTVLPNGYAFSPVTIKAGNTHIKTITVTNTGDKAYTVNLVATAPNPSITLSWTNSGGVSIPAGESRDFVLTITGVTVTDSIDIPLSITRE